MAVLFLQEFDPVKVWCVLEQCWCSKEPPSGARFLAEKESLLRRLSPGEWTYIKVHFNLEKWNKEEWPASLADVGVFRTTSNGPVHWGGRSLRYKILSRTRSLGMCVKSVEFVWWGFGREWSACSLHEVSNKVKGRKIISQQGAYRRELT